jgi:hypothetical protein
LAIKTFLLHYYALRSVFARKQQVGMNHRHDHGIARTKNQFYIISKDFVKDLDSSS